MGKVEKVIVLSVLFLIALILVVSLTVDDPLNKARVVEAGAPPAPSSTVPAIPAPEVANAQGQPKTPGLLSAEVTPAAPTQAQPVPVTPPAPAPAPEPSVVLPPTPPAAPALPAGALLKKLDGLQDSILPDMKLYTWKEGDSFRAIAHAYYGNWEKLTVLKRSNEGRTDVKPGQTIFIPVFDSDRGGAAGSGTGERLGAADKGADVKGGAAAPAATSNGVHVVLEGESLWKIAKKKLGNGGRWKEIYDLNRDVLASPESVHKGQRLRLP
ncbi:MAG: LysM peptidoglycan-binding domain-containing protein [Planctomycetes bacterium]|nr:LysM peptidoglycan-binding domain-containing protein [Planctomycetota bacterium]